MATPADAIGNLINTFVNSIVFIPMITILIILSILGLYFPQGDFKNRYTVQIFGAVILGPVGLAWAATKKYALAGAILIAAIALIFCASAIFIGLAISFFAPPMFKVDLLAGFDLLKEWIDFIRNVG